VFGKRPADGTCTPKRAEGRNRSKRDKSLAEGTSRRLWALKIKKRNCKLRNPVLKSWGLLAGKKGEESEPFIEETRTSIRMVGEDYRLHKD